MDQEIFKENLVKSVLELNICCMNEIHQCRFMIIPVIEDNKKYNSKDDFMRMTVFRRENLNNKLLE